MRHRRGGYDAQVEDVNAGRGDSRRDGRGNELPGCAGIAREEGDWSGVAFTFGEHLRCRYREREGEFRRDDAVRFAANSIGTKKSGHVPFPIFQSRPRDAHSRCVARWWGNWLTAKRPRGNMCHRADCLIETVRWLQRYLRRKEQKEKDQRLEYWGALRAFFNPPFLRSTARESRVRKPAFFRVGPLFSSSIAFSARAIPRRSAPAWPESPPPEMSAMTSKRPSMSKTVQGSCTICWCTLFGKYVSRSRPLIFHWPVPGTRRTRATARLRRPTPWPGAVRLGPRPPAVASGLSLV